ncbi:MAG: carbohydrate kinase family protein [Anaerolineae bacterium]|jgi:pseudouridine kinase|nr:carbohydrate kinase family protein [Anaerolineae bacterium]
MSEHEHRVLVIGAAGLDLRVRPRSAAVEPGRSNPGDIRWGWGGVARNIAENLARLGTDVELITAVGDDWLGQALLARLHDLGIGTEGCLTVEGQPTSSYVALYDQGRDLQVAFDAMGIVAAITPGHLDRLRRLVREADIICIDANPSPGTLQTLFRLTEKYDVPVCADPTAALLASKLRPYLPAITAITPSRDEAEVLLETTLADDDEIRAGARGLVQAGVGLAAIMLGPEGLCYATSEESGRIAAFQADVVDPSGAGDALTAAVAYGLLEGVSPEEAVRLGMAAAAQTVICRENVCPSLSPEMLYELLVL